MIDLRCRPHDYYFEKDVAVEHVPDSGGHRHDWEHIAVWVKDDQAKWVSASQHGLYTFRRRRTSEIQRFARGGQYPLPERPAVAQWPQRPLPRRMGCGRRGPLSHLDRR
jgi:hypothetical protein